MLKKRLIACLLWRDGLLVQSKQFNHTNSVGDAYTAVDFFNTWAIDEIVLLDVTRTTNARPLFHGQLRELSKRCFVPLAVGGWVTSTQEIRALLSEGADKVVINSGVVERGLITEAAEMFGAQCVVASIDVKRNERTMPEVFINRGKEPTGKDAIAWAQQAEEQGAGEIFLTSIDRDGQMNGYDLELVQAVSSAVRIPVIASGGVGEWQHLVDGIRFGGADAVSAANIFHYSDQSTKKAKDYLKEAGVDVREPEFYKIALPRRPVYRV